MGFLWDWSKILVVVIMILGLVLKGYLSPVISAVLMALYVIFRGAVRGSGGITKTIFWGFEISFILLLAVNVLAGGGGVVNLIPRIIGLFSVAVAWIIELVLEGRISIYHAIGFVVIIFILQNIGKHIGNTGVHRVASNTFLIAIPIAMFFVFAYLYGGGSVLAILIQLLPLLLLLFGFYIMFFGWASSQRKR